MKIEDIKKICVIGAGSMGHQIAFSAALSGYRVSCTDISLAFRRFYRHRWQKGKNSEKQLLDVNSRLRAVFNIESRF